MRDDISWKMGLQTSERIFSVEVEENLSTFFKLDISSSHFKVSICNKEIRYTQVFSTQLSKTFSTHQKVAPHIPINQNNQEYIFTGSFFLKSQSKYY